jgi:hydroxyacylglutathione hydrolase
MRVETVPCLQDNYAYVVLCPETGAAGVIDPSEPGPVLDALARLGVAPSVVLATHHHHDHVGGIEGLLAKFPGIPVVAHAHDKERVPHVTKLVEAGDEVSVGALRFRALHVPGHTLGAVAWTGHGAVFTGDTMFLGGCGRLFEGTPAMMHRSLNEVLGALDGATRVYCGHEYTVSNLKFARHLEPDHPSVRDALARAEARRAAGEPTVPGTLAEERATNPFLRCGEPGVRAAVKADGDDVAVLAAVRLAKDHFRA